MKLELFRRLALVATLVALCVVVMGAWVRLSHAGLGCPDWPEKPLIDQAEGDVDTLRNIFQHAQQLGASEGVLNAIKTAATKEN